MVFTIYIFYKKNKIKSNYWMYFKNQRTLLYKKVDKSFL
jgi:hypothetical protein